MCLSHSLLLSFDYLNPKNQELNFELYHCIVSSGGEWNTCKFLKFLCTLLNSFLFYFKSFIVCRKTWVFDWVYLQNLNNVSCEYICYYLWGSRSKLRYIFFRVKFTFLFFWLEQNFKMICCVWGFLLLIWVMGMEFMWNRTR